MRLEKHIIASYPQQPQSCVEKFRANQGSGQIELTPYGDYILNTYGMTDGAARRTAGYKNAYNKVSLAMIHAYESETRAYTSIHRNMPNVESIDKLKKDIEMLAPQKYERKHFDIDKPTKNDIEADLIEEAKNINFDQANEEKQVDEKTFLKQHINEMIEIRQQAWQEARNLFDQIEDAREEKENNRFLSEYKATYNSRMENLEGREEDVKLSLDEMFGTLTVPYNLGMTLDYSQAEGLLVASVVMQDGITIPTSKATRLASGKVSINNKLVRETINEKTYSALSLIYFLAGHLFNTSPNIKHLRISLYERDQQNPLLWVEFERERFSRTKIRMIDMVSDIDSYPNVLKLKKRTEAVELCIWKSSIFEKEVANAINNAHERSINDE